MWMIAVVWCTITEEPMPRFFAHILFYYKTCIFHCLLKTFSRIYFQCHYEYEDKSLGDRERERMGYGPETIVVTQEVRLWNFSKIILGQISYDLYLCGIADFGQGSLNATNSKFLGFNFVHMGTRLTASRMRLEVLWDKIVLQQNSACWVLVDLLFSSVALSTLNFNMGFRIYLDLGLVSIF